MNESDRSDTKRLIATLMAERDRLLAQVERLKDKVDGKEQHLAEACELLRCTQEYLPRSGTAWSLNLDIRDYLKELKAK